MCNLMKPLEDKHEKHITDILKNHEIRKHQKEVALIKESLLSDFGKEYRINQDITIGGALEEIWENFDVNLIGASTEHIGERTSLMHEAIDALGFKKEEKVADIIPNKYLQHPKYTLDK
jgi:hypothetical protein